MLETWNIVDDVNALLKLGVGDAYRLEHIKQSYIDNKTIWITDSSYLNKLREQYLVDPKPVVPEKVEDGKGIFCWKCGKNTPLNANFCMVCGSSLFDVGSQQKTIKKELGSKPKKRRKILGKKLLLVIMIPIISLIILGALYNASSTVSVPVSPPTDDPESRCGPGTIFDETTSSCELDERCGAGTIYDDTTNSCVLI